ncbi:hypothetical protein [Lacipirellula parvula]|uniref:Lipoprotein n=1 Tax=Lacipirellula parvula TaxID=2650471 RepID=A0A5K7X8N3_9BACT|nr:hypothetical protein [Lacipirellula parvula]BBO30656.1 hypothetical protein PLANPX_0268 [Lacipirellula parvula]
MDSAGCRASSVAARWSRRTVGWALMLAMALSFVGCERPAKKLPAVPVLPASNTAEGKLARIMQRFDDALESAEAAGGSGVISERRAYSKLITPEDGSEPREAIIFIETKRALAPVTLNAAAKRKLEEAAKAANEELAEGAAKPFTMSDTQQIETAEFPMVYDGEAWKLAKELPPQPAGEPMSIEKILFDYALHANGK